MAVVQKLAPQIQEAMGAEGVLIQQFNGAAAGQTVFHLHVHIVPRKQGEALKPHAGKMEDQAKLAATAEKIRKKLASLTAGSSRASRGEALGTRLDADGSVGALPAACARPRACPAA